QVFMNIMDNAIDAMPEGGRLHITTSESETHIQIGISDTGIGMDLDTRNKLFEPFFTTKEVGEGTGLGLSISIGIIQNLKGSISVENLDGKGTCFEILLPVRQHKKVE
nr:GHKL domain-containing protein [Flammeovirgaceae bacterium]